MNDELYTNIRNCARQAVKNVAWANIKLILLQQVPQYIDFIERGTDSDNNINISDINALLTYINETFNNTLELFLKQKISISKLTE